MGIKAGKRRKSKVSQSLFREPVVGDDVGAWVVEHDALLVDLAKQMRVPGLIRRSAFAWDAWRAGVWLGRLTGDNREAAERLSSLIRSGVEPFEAATVAARDFVG